MNYRTLRDAVIAIITSLKLVSRVEQYQGQIDTMAGDPSEWNPMCDYILVQAQGAQFNNTNTSSVKDLNATARIVLYIGVNVGETFGDLEDRMFGIIDALSDLNAKYLAGGIGQLRHLDDSYEMSLDQHLIWTMTFAVQTLVREG